MPITRDTSDSRRAAELDKRLKTLEVRTSVPALGQLEDGQTVYIKGTGQKVWRVGNKLYTSTGTEVT